MKRNFRPFLLLVFFLVASPTAYFYYLWYSIPDFMVERVDPQNSSSEKSKNIPLFMVMAPLPWVANHVYLPQLEYKAGPPKRFLQRIQVALLRKAQDPLVHFEFYGRRTLNNAPRDIANQIWRAVQYRKTSKIHPATSSWNIVEKFRLLSLVKDYLPHTTTKLYVMDQASIPAFLIIAQGSQSQKQIEKIAKILFFRRNTLQEIIIRYPESDSPVDPLSIFQKTFLVENRQDALGFIAKELSQINLKENPDTSLSTLEWPLLLLSSQISNEPSSIQAYFHFAGINALLFRQLENTSIHLEVRDSLRNNVLVADRYGKDIAPDSKWSAEMSRLARALKEM